MTEELDSQRAYNLAIVEPLTPLDQTETHLNNDFTVLVVVLIGSILGSLKADSLSKHHASKLSRFNNIGLGIFVGVASALYYVGSTSIWVAAIVSLISASLSVSIIDSIFYYTPDITKQLVTKWLNIETNEITKDTETIENDNNSD